MHTNYVGIRRNVKFKICDFLLNILQYFFVFEKIKNYLFDNIIT